MIEHRVPNDHLLSQNDGMETPKVYTVDGCLIIYIGHCNSTLYVLTAQKMVPMFWLSWNMTEGQEDCYV